MPAAATPPRHAWKRRSRRRLALGVILVVVIVSVGGWFGVALLRPLPATAAVVDALQPAASTTARVVLPPSGSAAIGIAGRDEPLAESGGTDPRPIGSITKVVTVLAVLEQLPLGPGEDGRRMWSPRRTRATTAITPS